MTYCGRSRCNSSCLRILFVLIMAGAMSFAASIAQKVRVYPAPKGIELSSNFTVTVEGSNVPVYKTKIPPASPIPRLDISRSGFGFASLVSFDIRASVDVTVTCPEPVKSIKILPTFKLSGKNITFRGRGIIDQADIPRSKRRYSLLVHDSRDVTIEGVIFLDPSRWTVPIKRSDKVHVDNIKIIGWRGNSDGVDISSSRDVLVENCFMRTFDDLVVVKTRTEQGEAKNIHVRNCVLWNELAHALSIGAEVRENVSNVLFEDCDVIHDVGRETALRVYHCDNAVISNVRFK